MLKIALEPEAASIYAQYLPIERNPDGFGMTKEGTRYMIVDIGGMFYKRHPMTTLHFQSNLIKHYYTLSLRL